MSEPLAAVTARFVNHVLARAEWARTELQAHAGRSATLLLPPLEVTLTVTAVGELRAADADEVAAVRIGLSPLDALRFLAGDREVFRQATLEGDVAFAATLRHLAANLRWDYEEDLSRFIGDVAAHRAAEMLRTVVAWPREAGARMAQSGAEYITEEAGWLPPAAEVEAWLQAVDRLRDDTERLEQRIAALEARRG